MRPAKLLGEQMRVDRDVLDGTPFVLVGSRDQVIDKLQTLRGELGINHFVVRDADGFAPIVDALSGT